MKTTGLRMFAALAAALMAMTAAATNWTYDGSAKQKYLLDDTGWKFAITLDKSYTYNGTTYKGTEIGSFATKGTATSLDFSSGLPEEIGDIVGFYKTFYVSAMNVADSIQHVVLPETVVCIGESTFRSCANLESITPMFPDKVQYFGSYAVDSCPKLTGHVKIGATGVGVTLGSYLLRYAGIQELTFGDGVLNVPATGFRECTSLTNVNLGANVTTISESAFRSCTSLQTITPFLPETVTDVGQYVFYGCKKLTGHLRLGFGPKLSFHSGGTVFSNCESLEEVTFGPAPCAVPQTAFRYCYGLTNLTLGAGVGIIGTSAFRDCTGLKTVTPFLPESVTNLGANAFNACSALSGTLTIGGGETGSADIAWDSTGYQFSSCSALEKIVIGPGVTSLPAYCFAKDFKVTEVDFYSFPTWASTAFGTGNTSLRWKSRQARFLVPSGDDGWMGYMDDTSKMTPWSDSELAAYQTKFGEEATVPNGITVSEGCQYVVVKPKAETDAKTLQITGDLSGEKLEIGTVTPDYDAYDDVTSELPLTVSAERYAEVGDTLYECTGYVISEFEDDKWVNAVTNAVRSFVYNPSDNTQRKVTWLWKKAGYRPSVVFPSNCGSVTADEPWTNGYYHAGAEVTYTATPAEGFTFGGWYGKPFADGYAANATVTVTIDGEISFTPYFAKDWEIAGDGKSMSDGYWTIPISGKTDALTLSYPTVIPVLGLLDLRKPVTGGVIAKAADYFLYKSASAEPIRTITEIRLPDTLVSIGNNAFRNLPNLVRVTPFLPESLTYLGNFAFSSDGKLASALVLGSGKGKYVQFAYDKDDQSSQFGYCHSIPTVTLGEGVTNVPGWFIVQAAGPDEITLLGDVRSLGKGCFRQSSVEADKKQPRTFKIASFPASCGVAPFQNWNAYKTCVYVPRGNAAWQAWMADSEEMTPWDQLGDIQAKFTENFPEMAKHPKGLSVKDDNTASGLIFRKQWIFTWDPNPSGLSVILR